MSATNTLRLFEVSFVDDRYGLALKVRATDFVEALAKVRAKYPDREVNGIYKTDKEEILE